MRTSALWLIAGLTFVGCTDDGADVPTQTDDAGDAGEVSTNPEETSVDAGEDVTDDTGTEDTGAADAEETSADAAETSDAEETSDAGDAGDADAVSDSGSDAPDGDTACAEGSYFDGSACATCSTCSTSHYESMPCTGISNRVCMALTECTTSQYQSAAPTATADRVCSSLTACTTSEYQSTAPTATTDRVCSPLTECTTSQYETTAPTSTSNRVCTALTACTSSQYQSTAPTATTDRVCSPLRECTTTEYQSAAPTATSNRVCTAITECTTSQYESAAPTTTSDRVCLPITECTTSEYETAAPTSTSNRVCTALTECVAPAYQSTAPTATTDRSCTVATSCKHLHTFAPSLTSGSYAVRWPVSGGSPTDVSVYCDMNTDGGGWTLVRRNASTTAHFGAKDNLDGSYSEGTSNGSATTMSTFALPFDGATYTEFRFATGDEAHWLIANKSEVQSGYTSDTTCTQSVTIRMSSTSTTSYSANWCKRSGNDEDPWISVESHGTGGKTDSTDDASHSMLYGENGSTGWLYYLQNNNGLNVFVR